MISNSNGEALREPVNARGHRVVAHLCTEFEQLLLAFHELVRARPARGDAPARASRDREGRAGPGCRGARHRGTARAGARAMTLRKVSVEQACRPAAQTIGRLLAVIVVDGHGFAITTWGRTRAACRGLKRWSKNEGDDVVAGIVAWAALEKP